MDKFTSIELQRVEGIDDLLDLRTWLAERRPILAFDVETSGLNRGKDVIRLFQVGDRRKGWALDYRDWRGAVKELIEGYDRPLVAHNLLFDATMLEMDGIRVPQRQAHDTMVMCFLTNPVARMDLKGAAAKYVDPRAAVGQDMLEHTLATTGWSWATVPTDFNLFWEYGVLDTCLTALLAEELWPKVRDSYRPAYETELACIHCLRDAELVGLLVDEEVRQQTAEKLMREIEELRPQIPVDNPGSDRQVIAYLQSVGAPLFMRTEKGNLSVDKHVMRWLAANGFSIASKIGAFRSRTKMLGSYVEKFADVGDGGLAVNGVLRASTRPLGAKTGRMTVTEPPLQTLPRGRVVRDLIVARPGHRLLLADFKAMEMRALASLSSEQAMLQAFARGEDFHDYVSTELFNKSFTRKQRDIVKNANFAKAYGAGVEKFAITAGIPLVEAGAFLTSYDERFPRVAAYMQEMINSIHQQAGGRRGTGKVQLQDGRDLVVEGAKAYVSVNYRIQGGCAVVLKERINELDASGLGPFFRLAVHDELIYEVPEEHVPTAREIIKRVMPDDTSFPGVILEIDQDEVHRWGAHYRGAEYPKYVETPDPEWLT